MATAHPLPAPSAEQPREPGSTAAEHGSGEQSLVPSPRLPEEQDRIPLGEPLASLPVELEVSVPVREFRVRNLLALEPGEVIESQWTHGEDLPVASGQVQLAWSEFEVVDSQLAVRITRLA
ncbi:MAG: FliM/FliN family flagellar motor C-terminal domain-containing protein [Terracidiphilus sp.]